MTAEADMGHTICVVILHYNDYEMTARYIDNLRQLNWGSIHRYFVIVDNCSPDHSGRLLYETFQSSHDVTVILNRCNLGFAKGNNVGISYAENRFNPDLVIVSNNDVYLKDMDFPGKLWEIYRAEPAAVIGPDIYSLRRKIHQSPIRKQPLTKEQLENQIKSIDSKLKKLQIVKLTRSYDLISSLKRLLGIKSGTEGYQYDTKQANVVLQGAFFVLSRLYLEKYRDGLYDGTFLYMEEDILSYRCSAKKLKTLYTPKLKVYHYDGYSTVKSQGNRCDKYMFELREIRKSCTVMLRLLNQESQIN